MGKIYKLDKNLTNQIAAGEVVERPISVVKELVENSIDAGANNIRIEINNGGIDFISVSDNGEGISRDDLNIITEKYTTSKIKSLDDLYNLLTFGFRGEALSSISSVSDFKISSKYIKSNIGYSFYNGEITEVAIEIGTKITVENLFSKTPARLNYLKKPRTEYSHIYDFLNNMSLSYPKIGFEFISDSKQIFIYRENESIETRIKKIYSEEFGNNMIETETGIIGLKVSGFISDPKVSFSNRNKQIIFVNNRLIKSPIIYKAISNAYNRYIPHSCFPAYILNLQIDPTQIDVNVHPRKQEIRFASEKQIFSLFYHSIDDNLKSVSLISLTQNNTDNLDGNIQENKQYYTGSGTKFKSYSPYKDTSVNPNQGKIHEAINFSKNIISKNNNQNYKDFSDFDNSLNNNDLSQTKMGKIIGQSHNSYIIVETNVGLQILDQHALAERIIYEKLINSGYTPKTQGLLIGDSIKLSPKEYDIAKNNKQFFEKMGFDFELLSNNIILVSGIPDFIKKENISNIVLAILSDIGEEKTFKSKSLDEVRNKIAAYTACRSAIKFGDKLNLFEINKLLNDAVTDYSATCPHGRPVILEYSLDELKGKFER